ncbi:MAG: hypothetical protein Q8P18_33375 [Pseudomonadota bacterium]|nr:hypothetical protein [Pseudomonadota bacterium]
MRWISVGEDAHGVIAIGQFATGVIALGQVATGVIAVGQVARGFVAIGQVSIGVFAVGMGSVGLVYSVGMLGAGGRGLGIILPLVPSFGPALSSPDTVPAGRLLGGKAREGWVDARLDRDTLGPVLVSGGEALDVRFDVRLRRAVETQADAQAGALPVTAHLTRTEGGWVCDQLQQLPARRWRTPGWWVWWGAQLAGLAVAAVAFWALAGIPVVQALFNRGGILVSP